MFWQISIISLHGGVINSTIHRHDISDHVWSILDPLLPGRNGNWGGKSRDNRLFINAVFWILCTETPWRDLPPEYGEWKNPHRRFCRWRDKGIWEEILSHLMDIHDFKWLLTDSTYCRVYPHAAGAKEGNEALGRTKGGSTPGYIWPWMRMVCRSELPLQRVPQRIAHKQP